VAGAGVGDGEALGSMVEGAAEGLAGAGEAEGVAEGAAGVAVQPATSRTVRATDLSLFTRR